MDDIEKVIVILKKMRDEWTLQLPVRRYKKVRYAVDVCLRVLEGDKADLKVKTRGDKIRQSNESLFEFIKDLPRNVCNIDEDGILEYLNQPAESEE